MNRTIPWVVTLVAMVTMLGAPFNAVTVHAPQQLSPRGGIGNTRADFEREWGPLTPLTDPMILERGELAYYDTSNPNEFLMVTYQLVNANKTSSDDRVILISLGWDSSESMAFAQAMVAKYLPGDAELERTKESHYGHHQEVYTSKSVATEFPVVYKLDESIKGNGRVWVTYEPFWEGQPGIGAIEIALYDDEA